MPDGEDTVLVVVTGVACVVLCSIGVHHTGLLMYVQMATHVASHRETATASWVGAFMGYVSDVSIEGCLRDETRYGLTLFPGVGVHVGLDSRGQPLDMVLNAETLGTYLQTAGPVKGLIALSAYMAAGAVPTSRGSALRWMHAPIGPSRVWRGRVSGVTSALRAGLRGERGQLNVLPVHLR